MLAVCLLINVKAYAALPKNGIVRADIIIKSSKNICKSNATCRRVPISNQELHELKKSSRYLCPSTAPPRSLDIFGAKTIGSGDGRHVGKLAIIHRRHLNGGFTARS